MDCFGGESVGLYMLGIRWSIQSPWPAPVLADRIRATPRWNGWRDGFADGRFLIAEQYPVEVSPDGFRFVVASSKAIHVVCQGRFHPLDGGTGVEVRATPHPASVVVLAVMALLVLAVSVIGLWSVSPWLAIWLPVAAVIPAVLIWAVGFRINARWVRRRVTDFLTRKHNADAAPGTSPGE
jgi:hypothetical protein